MRFDETPALVARAAADTVAELRRRRPAFVPEWHVDGGAGDALQRIVARYAQVIADRLNQAPDRAFLAFLDMLGISLISPRPARAPIVFTTFAGLGDGRAPAGTRVGATVAGVPSPVVFETESAIGLAGARLTDVVTVWPDRDAYAEHSSDAAGGRPFSLFRPLKPVPHMLYVAHDRVFDVAKDASIEIAIELGTPGSHPVAVVWEYWDGQVWQGFKELTGTDAAAGHDGTAGFTRSGSVSLQLTCGRPAKTTVAGIKATWIRARTTDPLPPDPARVFAAVDRIRARSIVTQSRPLELDAAHAGTLKLDVTSTFYPFGLTAVQGDLFYFANDEAFSKAGASVDVAFNLASPAPLAQSGTLVRFQYWNGERWLKVPDVDDGVYFAVGGLSPWLTFTIPADVSRAEVNGETRFWFRAQVVRGGYFYQKFW